MTFINVDLFKDTPLISAATNPSNIISFGGLTDKTAYDLNSWITKYPGKTISDINVPYHIEIARGVHSTVIALIIGLVSTSVFIMSIKYSRVDFSFHPAYLAIEYFGVTALFLYQVVKNAVEDLKRDHKAIKEKDPSVLIGTALSSYKPFHLDLTDDNSYAAFNEKYHAKISSLVFKIMALTSVLAVCSLGAAGIMDMKRVSQVLLGVGCIGYYVGTYLLRVRSDFNFFNKVNNSLIST